MLPGLLLAAVVGACGGREPVSFLVVVLDTTRADRLSCYGYGKPTTPAIDALAQRGARFEAAFAQSSLTPVSAATILSGANPYRHGVRSLFVVGEGKLSEAVASWPELCRASGRRTAAFVSARPMGAHYGLSRGFETYDDDFSETRARYALEGFADAPQRPGDETVDRALEWLAGRAGEPFALLVHLFDAHDASFLPPREFLEPRVSFPLPPGLGRLGDPKRFPELHRPERLVEIYDAEIAWMDMQVARLLERLRSLGELERTLVCVVADHGEAFGEHGFWTHGILYQEQLRVPLILAGPGVPEGVAPSTRARLADLLPTLVELLDLPLPAQPLDGASLAPFLAGSAHDAERPVYAEVHHAPQDRLRREPEMYSLQVGDWKYIHRPASGRHELYDLRRDPAELENRIEREPAMARVLERRLAELGALGSAPPSLEGIPEDELERLRALGYL